MRRWAASVRTIATTIGRAGDGAADSVNAATFTGPAGDQTRFRAGRLRKRTATLAGELRTLADTIARRAGTIELEQDAWDRVEQRNRKLAD